MQDFSNHGELVTVPAGAGYLGTQPTVLVSEVIPSGVQAMIESLTCRALDVDVSQIRFALRRNGASPSLFLSSIPATMFESTATLPMRETMSPGVVEIVAYNLSGTGLPNAGPAVSPLCQAGWYGSLAPVPQPETVSRWMPSFKKKLWKVGLCLVLSLGISHYEKSYAQTLVVPGSTTARSALPIACVNPTTFVLEACGGGGAGGGLTDAELRASPVPVTIPVPTPVTGTFWQATQPVSGTFFQVTQPVSGTFWQATQPVSGTFWQATQPVSLAAFPDNEPFNLSQVGGTATVNGGLAGSLAIGGTGANNAAITQNPDLVGCEALTYGTQPTAATTGNLRRIPCTTEGAIPTTPGHNRFSCFVQAVTVTTQCQAAPAAGLRNYVLSVALSNQAATVQSPDIVYGTGANCVTGITALTHKFTMGTLSTTTNFQVVTHTFLSPLVPVAANAICIRPSAATAFGATITGYIAP